jgi:thiosulfate dehydrogenase (quinone) large subunit
VNQEPDQNAEDVAALTFRVLLGLLFLVAGVSKLRDLAAFSQAIHSQYDSTFLPGLLLSAFIAVLPFVEVALGALLLAGWLTRWALHGSAVTLLVLFFGRLIAKDGATSMQIAVYVLITMVALRSSASNRYSIDHLLNAER